MRVKIVLPVLFISVLLVTSCELFDLFGDEAWKVYSYDGDSFNANETVVARPSIPSLIHSENLVMGSSISRTDLPWTIEGKISNGFLSMDFPDNKELWSDYSSEYTNGVKVARVHITLKDLDDNHLALHKLDSDGQGIDIYYTDGEIIVRDYDGTGYPLYKGWNFVDEDNKKVYQDIDYLFDLGYRWQLELWD